MKFRISLKFTGIDPLATQTYQQIRFEFHIQQKLQCHTRIKMKF